MDKIRYSAAATKLYGDIATQIVKDVFDSGSNIRSDLVGFETDQNFTFERCKIRIRFDGNFISSNHYETTFSLEKDKYEFVNSNSLADKYLVGQDLAKVAVILIKIREAFKALE